MLKVDNLSFSYDDTSILKRISLSISSGDFILLCGSSGSGKTTLLRHMKNEMLPVGNKEGIVYYDDTDIETIDTSTSIGYVFQNPDHQIVSDRVYHELAFGLENQNMPLQKMRQRIAEFLQYFNMSSMYHQETDTLSGGQKQILNLASILLMQPKVVLLDEPLSQLDPMMQETFMQMVIKLNNEFGIAIVMVEHQYERVLPICNKVLVLQNGEVEYFDKTKNVVKKMLEEKHDLVKGLPAYYRLYPYVKEVPTSIKEAKTQLLHIPITTQIPKYVSSSVELGKVDKLAFGYDSLLLKDISFPIYKEEIIGIIGSNGSGKTTLLKVMLGILKKQKGKVQLPKEIGYISQDPTSLFLKDTVYEDLQTISKDNHRIEETLRIIGLYNKQNLHPYDLSGGEQQLLALGKVLLTKPQLLLLDEPTKGLDINSREKIGILLQTIKSSTTTIIVSHDVEFIAKYTNRCGMLFDCYLESLQDTRELLKDNTFYTTTTRKICKDYQAEILLYEDIVFP
ncbi:MAG: ABC transporter ATP-binding protein [Coprobacillaceae bacterium]